MYTLKLRAIGTSIGTTIPSDLLEKLGARAGDTIYATEMPDGTFSLMPYNSGFAAQMDQAEQIMGEDHDMLKAQTK